MGTRNLPKDMEHLAIIGADLGIWDTYLETGLTLFNERWATMLGYEWEELNQHFSTWEKLVHPDDYKGAVETFEEHIYGESGQYAIEHRLKCKDGSWKWILSRGRIVERDDQGRPLRVVGTHLDISDRKDIEQKISLFDVISSNASDSFIITNRDGQIEWVNEAFEDISGYRFEEVRGKKPGAFLQGADTDPRAVEIIGKALKACEPVEVDILNYHKTGYPYWISLHINPYADYDGKVTHFVGIQRDITERRAYEEEILEYRKNLEQKVEEKTKDLVLVNAQLDAEEKRIKAIMNHVMEGLIVIDSRGLVQDFNPGAERIFGYKAEEVIGQNVKMLMPENMEKEHDGYIKNYVSGGPAKVIGTGREVQGQKKDGSLFPIALSITEIEIEGQQYFVGTTRDITEEKVREHELIHAKEDAERANRIKDDFLANMSHELRTPLNSIMGLTRVLMKGERDDKAAHSLDTIYHASSSLLKNVNDILDISKIEANKLDLEETQFNIADLLHQTADRIRPLALQKGLGFEGNYDAMEDINLFGDSFRLEKILNNILSNAVKYTEDGHITFDCDLIYKEQRDFELVIRIEDTGIGIPADKIDYIFEKFAQTDETVERRYGGTGLGLNITQQLVDMMGGDIQVESEEGRGSVFTARIPFVLHIKDQQQGRAAKIDYSAAQDGLHTPIQFAKILVAEDNDFNVVFIQELLEQVGCDDYDVVSNGVLAVEAARKSHYDLILMDYHMPEMSGYDAAEEIRKFNADIPILAVTADLRQEARDLCVKVGMNGLLEKPLDEDKFVDVLSGWFLIEYSNEEELFSVAHSPDLIDLQLLKDFTRGDEEKLKKLISLFYTETQKDLEKMQDYNDTQDNEDWCKIAHKLKGSASYVQAKKLEEVCRKAHLSDSISPAEKHKVYAHILSLHQDVYDYCKQNEYL